MTRAEHWRHLKWALSMALGIIGFVWLVVAPVIYLPVSIFVWHLGFFVSIFAVCFIMLIALVMLFVAVILFRQVHPEEGEFY